MNRNLKLTTDRSAPSGDLPISRRRLMSEGGAIALAGSAAFLGAQRLAAANPVPGAAGASSSAGAEIPGEAGSDYVPVVTPNGSTLAFKVVDGVKVFHLVANQIEHEFAPGLIAHCWGYNGSSPGPTIEAVEGDHCRIYVTNQLPMPTTVHWHGLRIPSGMDGVNGLTQEAIPPGQTFRYEFVLRDFGSFMYHPHYDEMTQQGMGMMGMLIVHPRRPTPAMRVDRDFAIMLSEWRIDPGTSKPNPLEMIEFNVLTMNSKVYPATAPLVIRRGQRVRLRFGNLSAMEHHPIHLHGFQFTVTQTDGGQIPDSAQYNANTILVPVGSTRAVEFTADVAGDWVMHCHMTHHTMNQMGHNAPNMLGIKPGDLDAKVGKLLPGYMTMGESGMADMADMSMPVPKNSIPMLGAKGPFGTIDMGGMFTILKVRDNLASYEDPGWYSHPAGTVAVRATVSELHRDGIAI